jgi:hypothetical protein
MVLDFFLRRRRKRIARATRARPRRGPMTAPAIQALLEDFFLLVVLVVEEERSVGVAVSAAPSLSVVLAAAVAEARRAGYLVSFGGGGGGGEGRLTGCGLCGVGLDAVVGPV